MKAPVREKHNYGKISIYKISAVCLFLAMLFQLLPMPSYAAGAEGLNLTADLSVSITAEEKGYSASGEVLHYTVKLKNTGNIPITGVSVMTSLFGAPVGPNGDYEGDNKLSPAETWIYTGKYTVTEADMVSGKVDNTVTAVSNEAPAVIADLTIYDPPAVLTLTKTASIASSSIPGYESGRTFNLNMTARTNVTDVYILANLDIVLALQTSSGMNNNAPAMYYPIGAFYDANTNDLIVSAKEYMVHGQTYYLSAGSTQPITWSSTINAWVNSSNVPVSPTYTGTIYAYTAKSLGYLSQASLKFVDDIILKTPGSRICIQSFNSVVTTTPNNIPLDLTVANITVMKQFILGLTTGNNSQSLLEIQAIKAAFDNTRINGMLPDRQRVSVFMAGDKPSDSSNFPQVYNIAQNSLQPLPYDVIMCSGNILSKDSTLITFLQNIATDPNRSDAVYPYYFLASQIDQLTNTVTQILKKVGSELQHPVVKDYITPMFDVINPLTGDVLTDNLPVGTNGIYHNSDGQQWIEWMPASINSDTDWVSGTITLKAKPDFCGGNYLPTNSTGSGVYMDGSLYGSEFPAVYVNAAIKYNLYNGTETIFKRRYSTLNIDTIASSLAMKPGTANLPYLSYGYGNFSYAWYRSDGVTSVPSPYTVDAPFANGTSYILKAVYTPLTPPTDPNAVASVGTPSSALQKQCVLYIQVNSGSITIINTVNYNDIPEPDQSFIFEIVRSYEGVNEIYYETIQGAGSKSLSDLPIGSYKVVVYNDWSWRYTLTSAAEYSFVIDSSQNSKTVTFARERSVLFWLSDVANMFNLFT